MSGPVNSDALATREVSILLPAHDNVCVPLVRDLQEQAARLPGLCYEIVVADDGSTDMESIQANRAINLLPHCRFIERKPNAGRAAIRNFLAREARYARLLFIDSDLHVCSPTFLERYVQSCGEVVVGGIRMGGDAHRLRHNLRYRYEKASEGQHDHRHRSQHPDRDFSAACFLISKAVIGQCPFDEHFRHYGYEDALLGKSLSAHGHPIAHIDNPILMDDYEDNLTYVGKTEEACRTLHQFRLLLGDHSKLVRWQERLSRHRMMYPMLERAARLLCPGIRRQLVTGRPSVPLFNAYKLLYYIRLCSESNSMPVHIDTPSAT